MSGQRRIYLASSWRNPAQPAVLAMLRDIGHEVYDFRNPTGGDTGFHWSDIDPEWKHWTPRTFKIGLQHDLAEDGFAKDFDAMKWADTCVLLLPCGRSAHLEAGWFTGNGRELHIVLAPGEHVQLGLDLAGDALPGKDIERGHSYGMRTPCSVCGDMDGCHEPARLAKTEPELMYKMATAIYETAPDMVYHLIQGSEES